MRLPTHLPPFRDFSLTSIISREKQAQNHASADASRDPGEAPKDPVEIGFFGRLNGGNKGRILTAILTATGLETDRRLRFGWRMTGQKSRIYKGLDTVGSRTFQPNGIQEVARSIRVSSTNKIKDLRR